MRGPAVLVLIFAFAAPARADKKVAAEHFALAESAERRQDWRTAIEEYKQAYAAHPHPSVHYNVARNYERLEEWSNALEFYRRYLEESPNAADADKVRQKIEELDAKDRVSRPPPAPGTGWLIVHANVEGAQVLIDGNLAGLTPYQTQVNAGRHIVEIHQAGYHPAHRTVQVTAGGAEQIRETLQPTGDKPPEPPARRLGFVGGFEYGYSISSTTGFRLGGFLGVRFWDRIELDGLLILSSQERAYGLESRVFLGRGAKRLYLHAAATLGKSSDTTGPEVDTRGIEGGIGFLWTTTGRTVLDYGLFAEINARVVSHGEDADETMTIEPEGENSFALVWMAGLAFH